MASSFSNNRFYALFLSSTSNNTRSSSSSSSSSKRSRRSNNNTKTSPQLLPSPPISTSTMTAGVNNYTPPATDSTVGSALSNASSDSGYFALAGVPSAGVHRDSISSVDSSLSSTSSIDNNGIELPAFQTHQKQPIRPQPTALQTSLAPAAAPPSSTGAVAEPPSPTASFLQAEAVRLDPLRREYPKPTHEPTIDELLARRPLKWSFSHHRVHARDVVAPAFDKDREAAELERTKMELLRAREEMQRLLGARR